MYLLGQNTRIPRIRIHCWPIFNLTDDNSCWCLCGVGACQEIIQWHSKPRPTCNLSAVTNGIIAAEWCRDLLQHGRGLQDVWSGAHRSALHFSASGVEASNITAPSTWCSHTNAVHRTYAQEDGAGSVERACCEHVYKSVASHFTQTQLLNILLHGRTVTWVSADVFKSSFLLILLMSNVQSVNYNTQ